MHQSNLFLILLFLFPFLSSGQNPDTKVDLENFNSKYASELLIGKLNEIRTEKKLHSFKYNGILETTAVDQAEYNRKTNEVGTEQDNKKMSTPFYRALMNGGTFSEVDEYDLAFEIQVKALLKQGRRKKKPSTYGEVVNYIAEEWVDERRLDEILYGEKYYQIGFGFAPNKFDGTLFVTIVLATEPYEKYPGFKYHPKSYKIAEYDRNICKSVERDFQYLAELFSDNLIIKDGAVYFHYHDLSLIEALLKSNKDALALDIILNEQYSCDHGNAVHPSPVYDGMMLKPVKKSKLLKGNPLKEQKEFKAKLGTLPKGVDSNDITMSLIVIKDKCACMKIAYNNLDGRNLRLLDVNMVVDTISIAESVDSNSRYLQFTVPFEKGKYEYQVEDIKPFLDSIQLNRFNIKEIDIEAYSSIEGNPISNKELAERRSQSILEAIGEYQLQEVKTKIETQENWDGFFESIKTSPYSDDYPRNDHNAVRAIVNSDTLKYDLEPYLKDQRKAEIKIFVESIYIDSLNAENLPGKFERAIKNEDFIRAKALQTLMYRAVKHGELSNEVLFEGEIPQFKDYVPLLNNRLAFQMEYRNKNDDDSLIYAMKMQLEALNGINPSYGHVNYNKQVVKLYYWSKDLNMLVIDEENRINEVKDFYRDIKKLYNTKIDNYFVNRLLLNYNIIAADYYYERQDYRSRVRALKEVRKYVKKAKLDREQTLTMSRYFIFQMQIDWAVQIMMPYIRKGDYDETFLRTFLSIAVYDEKHVKENMLHKYFDEMATKFPGEYCKMFGSGGMSVEYLSDIRIKSTYCETCH